MIQTTFNYARKIVSVSRDILITEMMDEDMQSAGHPSEKNQINLLF